MSDNTISPSDAGLLFHRWVTESIPVLVWFVAADKSMTAKVRGFVTSFTRDIGLCISTESPAIKPDTKLPAYLTFSDPLIAASEFAYSDETEVPEDFELGNGLRIKMPNGDTLIIAERRLNKE
jgi:hypothetical protein